MKIVKIAAFQNTTNRISTTILFRINAYIDSSTYLIFLTSHLQQCVTLVSSIRDFFIRFI